MSRTERMFADLERGFAALEDGRLEDAAAVVERCRRIDRKNPEVIALGAAVADAQGDSEDALAHYQELVELRPDDPMPRICIARIQLTDHLEAETALHTLAAAFEFIDEEADLIEAIYVKTQALIALEDFDKARVALEELSTTVIEDGDLALDFAELALAAQDPDAAKRWIEVARKTDPALDAEALHMLGRVHESTNDRPAMIAAWQQVRLLDMKAPDGNLTITEDEVERIALATLAELPDSIRQKLENVPILIDEFPSEHVVADGFDPRSLGLFQGTPMPDNGHAAPVVTNILLYRKNLERVATNEDHLAEEIRITVLHETAHYFGLDEDELEAIGLD